MFIYIYLFLIKYIFKEYLVMFIYIYYNINNISIIQTI